MKQVRYVLVGIVVTVFDFAIYSLLAKFLFPKALEIDSLVATFFAMFLAYFLHSRITWRAKNVSKREIARFFIWNTLAAVVVGPGFTWFFGLDFWSWLYQWAFQVCETLKIPFSEEFVRTTGIYVLKTLVVMVLNYLFYDKFVFGGKRKQFEHQNKDGKTLVSIIIPVYNVEKYLIECLNSVVNQTYQNLEIIIVNDGATDRSPEIINEFAKKDKRIKVINQKNKGLSEARNAGIRQAHGEYLTFVDADDFIKPDMVEYMLRGDAEIVICGHEELFENGKARRFARSKQAREMNTEEAISDMLNEKDFMMSAWGKLYKTELWEDVRFPKNKLHEDVGTTWKVFLKAKKIVFLPETKYEYRQRRGSISKNGFNEKKMDLVEETDEMCAELLKKYPKMKNTLIRRRMRARFSILWQVDGGSKTEEEMVEYLSKHRADIFENPETTKVERLALTLALINPELFRAVYNMKKILRK